MESWRTDSRHYINGRNLWSLLYECSCNLTPQGQLSNFWTFFPFGLKWKPLLRRHVMISVKSFSLKIKIMSCSFVKIIYIINIFYQLRAVNEYKSEVWKGKIPCPWGVNMIYDGRKWPYGQNLFKGPSNFSHN